MGNNCLCHSRYYDFHFTGKITETQRMFFFYISFSCFNLVYLPNNSHSDLIILTHSKGIISNLFF